MEPRASARVASEMGPFNIKEATPLMWNYMPFVPASPGATQCTLAELNSFSLIPEHSITPNRPHLHEQTQLSQVWWHTPDMPRQGDYQELEASLGYRVSPSYLRPKSASIQKQ